VRLLHLLTAGFGTKRPIKAGRARSLVRPGGTITGTLTQVEGLMGKRVELVLELMPHATTVGTEAVTRAPAEGHMLLLVVPANVDPAGLVGSSRSTCYRACP
jgi:hypothetical protein